MFDFNKIVDALKTDSTARGVGATGLAAGVLLGGGLGGLARYGALAAIGGLAYSAWQKHRQNGDAPLQPAPEGTPFMPSDAASREELGKSLVRAMIAAAKADGRIDGEEKQRIFQRLEDMTLSPEEKAFVFDELSSPLDLDAVVSPSTSPEVAAEIYAASLVAITADTAAERAYLQTLADRLGLDAALVSEIHTAAEQPRPAA